MESKPKSDENNKISTLNMILNADRDSKLSKYFNKVNSYSSNETEILNSDVGNKNPEL